MDPLLAGALGILAIIVLGIVGTPVAVAIGLTAAAGLLATSGLAIMLVNLQSLPYAVAADYTFVLVPMFILLGNIAASAGIIEALFVSASKWLGRVRGGLYMAVALASGGFAAVSGSTVVNAAVFTRLALPQMLRLGYDRRICAGCIAGAGTFSIMIPPSLGFVIYGIMTGESVGQLFMAGVVPGLMTVAAYMAVIRLGVSLRPHWAPSVLEDYSLREKLASIGPLWATAVLITIVLGGIYTGFMPPSSAGAIGALGALLIALGQRKMTLSKFWACVTDAAIVASTLFFIIISGFLFARFMISSGFVPELRGVISEAGIDRWEFVAIMVVLYLVLGIFIDGASMAVMTLPFAYPISQELGIDGIWFGVIFVKLVTIAEISPPVGLNLFTVVAASEGRLKIADVMSGIWPFFATECVVLCVLLAFPALSLWLPGLVY